MRTLVFWVLIVIAWLLVGLGLTSLGDIGIGLWFAALGVAIGIKALRIQPKEARP